MWFSDTISSRQSQKCKGRACILIYTITYTFTSCIREYCYNPSLERNRVLVALLLLVYSSSSCVPKICDRNTQKGSWYWHSLLTATQKRLETKVTRETIAPFVNSDLNLLYS